MINGQPLYRVPGRILVAVDFGPSGRAIHDVLDWDIDSAVSHIEDIDTWLDVYVTFPHQMRGLTVVVEGVWQDFTTADWRWMGIRPATPDEINSETLQEK